MRACGIRPVAASMLLLVGSAACGRSLGAQGDGGGAGGTVVSAPSTTAPGAPRTGMVWIPTGILRAGSPLDEVPRLADAELPGVDVPLGGFYIDVLPWPNEAGAIPTTNVTRQEAALLCQGKNKRLCSELEWERACKGPDNSRFEYGAVYDPRVCGAGTPAESASRRPSGERLACRSSFGARDMHGGAWEWTDSTWRRGGSRALGVVRGGGDATGELASRCAFARPVALDDRSPTTGFRCCAGPRNDAEVELEVKHGPAFERTAHPVRSSPALDALGGVACGPPTSPGSCSLSRAWTWRPAPNVELSLSGGCVGRDPKARCAVAVSRDMGDLAQTLAQIDTGCEIPEVVLVEGPDRRVRVRGADIHGQFFREIVFSYGRVDVKPVH
jgi:formylglycine-generating enzyme required for sulfatase activity